MASMSAVAARNIAIGAAAQRRLDTALIPRTESSRTADGLANGEIGRGTLRGLLAFGTGERRTNQRTVNRPLLHRLRLAIVILIALIARAIRGAHDGRGWHGYHDGFRGIDGIRPVFGIPGTSVVDSRRRVVDHAFRSACRNL
jgi:hypothetical protein